MTAFPVRSLLLLALALSLAAGSFGRTAAQDATPAGGELTDGVTVLPPDAAVAGVTRGEWYARWWQWAASFPAEVNPGVGEGGTRCGYGQAGPVFFLPGVFTPEPLDVACLVPAGAAVFVPVGGAECSTVEPPPFFGRDEAELRACAEAHTDSYTAVAVSVDGREVPDLERYRAASPPFALILPEGNVFGAPPGVAAAAADGYHLLLAPLPEGEHEIRVSAEVDLGDDTMVFEGTYRLLVAGPTVVEPAATPGAGTPAATPEA